MAMTRVRLLVAAVSLLAAVAFATTEWGDERLANVPSVDRLYTRWVPPSPPDIDDTITSSEVEALNRLGKEVRGRLVWSSNRGGNHDLYLADVSTGSVRRLTSHPHVDYFSRFSPDGTQISFLRSRRPWVSFRELDGWDLYLMNADGTNVRRLAEHAYHPTWQPDGTGVVFLRENKVIRLDLVSGGEELLQDGSTQPLEGRINNPELAPDGRLSVTVRHREQRVGVLSPDRSTYAPVSDVGACHITWVPGTNRVVWVSNEGRGGNRIMHGTPGAAGAEILIDLPGKRSHEYFPRVTNDGQWLVWGATAEGHEHDRADYEIFVWRMGQPWESALRITHSAANDQWPDLYLDELPPRQDL